MEKPVKLAMTTVTKVGPASERDKQEAGPERAKKGSSGEMRGGVPECLAAQGQAVGPRMPSFPDCFFYEWFCPKQQMTVQESRCEG